MAKNLIVAVLITVLAGSWSLAAAGESAAARPCSVTPGALRCEYLDAPLGIDVPKPRLSWKLAPVDRGARGQRQTAYQVLVATSDAHLEQDRGDLWDSGEIASDRATHVVYGGRPLATGLACRWKVRVRDQRGALSSWSAPAGFTMGLLSPADWTARWIGTKDVFERKKGWPPPDNTIPDPYVRKTFTLSAKPARATIAVASIGYHELYVNGKKVGDAVLAPSVANHKKRARYVTYDITEHLTAGRNAIGLWLGVSWSIFPPYKTDDKPAAPLAIAQADIELAGGERVRVATDDTWKTHPSPNALLGVWDFMHFGGERHDAGKEIPGWCAASFDDASWAPASTFAPNVVLSAEMVEPNRAILPIAARAVEALPGGDFRVDMGVNFAGWVEIDVVGKPGDAIEFQFSERADRPMTHRLRSVYVVGPTGAGTFRNRFNYGVGQWIRIRGLKESPPLASVRGFLVRTDYRRAGQFTCSDPLLNRIHAAVLWTFENLSLGGYVVDCPQRERMGYGGDAHATTEMALDHYELGAFYTKWSQDWRDCQGEDGNLPYTAPTFWGGGGPAWCGFCITLPWEIYQRYGDVRILEDNFATMGAWLAFLETKARDDLLVRWGGEWDFLGDWLWPGAKGVNGDTRETLCFNNCSWIYNLEAAAHVAAVLGKDEAAAAYRTRARAVRTAVHRAFFNPDEKSYVNGFQAYLAAALWTGVPPDDARPGVWKRLEDEILVVRTGHVHAGITGGFFLMKALIEAGRNDLVYAMASKEDYPGWGDMLRRGATTLWESWEGGDLSLLHSSYLWIGRWFTEGLAGIQGDPKLPGFKHFFLKPAAGGEVPLRAVEAQYESIHGTIRCAWKIEGEKLALAVIVPPNTTATLFLPTGEPASVVEGGKPACAAAGVTALPDAAGCAVFTLEPGAYAFEAAARSSR